MDEFIKRLNDIKTQLSNLIDEVETKNFQTANPSIEERDIDNLYKSEEYLNRCVRSLNIKNRQVEDKNEMS